ncbi:MAG: insulinase family protein [Bacteroidetes bacterium]|nr:insulinase family protein [Bacteroidota bacterium]
MKSLTSRLSSGIRIVYSENPSHVSHCGLMVGAGSRDEKLGKEGLAHFIEHVLFKGTEKRKAYQVLNRLEIVGGELNAYTTKEETCVHASFMNPHFERAVELIADIFFHSQFPEKEIEKEKEVVIDEINSYMDNPMEQIYDDFECQVFRNQPLGNPILGTHDSVRSFTRKDILKFIQQNYTNDRIVFSYTGNISFEKVKAAAEKYFGNEGSHKKHVSIAIKSKSKITHVTETRKTIQAHYIAGCKAYSCHSSKRFPLFLMNNILGGPGMNSRLNMNIREKYGFTYHIESAYVPFRDSGLFNIYLATEKKFLGKSVKLIEAELKKLRNDKIPVAQLSRFKYQLKGQIAISLENKAGVMLNNAKSLLNYNKPVDIDAVFKQLDNITPSDILEVANEILDSNKISSLLYNPEESD